MTSSPRSQQCQICGHGNPDVLEVHHLVPQRLGGSDAPENLVHLCGSCHNAVESLYGDDFYQRLGVDTDVDVSESASPTPSGQGGIEIEKCDSYSREIPEDSPHVVFESLRSVHWETKPQYVELFEERSKLDDGPAYAIHCAYCHTVFSHLEHPEAARHLQVEHGVDRPYEGAEKEEVELSSGFSNERVRRAQGTKSIGVTVQRNRLTPTVERDHVAEGETGESSDLPVSSDGLEKTFETDSDDGGGEGE